MIISPAGIELIQAFESCLKPVPGRDGFFKSYYDPVGVLTIGWGHTNHHPPRIERDTVWSQEECDQALDRDLDIFEEQVERLAEVELQQCEFDALVSWSYNTGGPKTATLWKRVNAEQRRQVPVELAKWNRGGGRILRGLTRRRKAEALMFVGEIEAALKVAHYA